VLATIARLSDSRVVEVNDAFMRMLGMENKRILGHDLKELGLWVDPARTCEIL
jgi:hypothetical protein